MSSKPGPVLTLAARWLFPVEGDPLEGACIDFRGGEIVAIGPREGRLIDLDYGNAGIMPGMVNAHCHLELEPLENEAWTPGDDPENEVSWLKRVVKQRWLTDPESYADTAAKHASELVRSGTTLVADITTAGASGPALVETPIRSVIYAEMIGLKRLRALTTNEAAWAWVNAVEPALTRDRPTDGSFRQRIGLSPHAPYSTAGWVYHQAVGSRMPLTTHLAEMPEELELLRYGTGPLRDFLDEIGAWPSEDEWDPIGPRPLDYVRHRDLRGADWLIAHANYLEEKDLWQLSPAALKPDQRMAVAYCPRTAHRFGHRNHPFRSLLERGAIVCLGTDSRASAPSLSILDEMRFLRDHNPDLSGSLIVAMGTLFGAWALRADKFCGSLKPEKKADLAVVALPDQEAVPTDPYSLILNSNLPMVATWLEGELVFSMS
ncbi:MAG: amidohydrolase [Planctomycetota bacterium]|nr:MAG: amidohydrolase [Planctomycetota bacterium]